MKPSRVLGSGPHVVLCLNGWFGHSHDWGPWEQFLDTDTFTWVFPDYRGYGTRREISGDYTLESVSDDLMEILDPFFRYDSLTVLGHSMGGAFGQHLITRLGERADAFVGVSPVPASGSPMLPEQRALFESAESEVDARRTIIDITTGNRLSSRWLDRMAEETTTNSDGAAVAGYFRAWADCDFLDEIGVQDMPALVIVGSHDPAVSAEVARASYGQTFRDLKIVELPDAGHYGMFEAPLRLATEIEAFLGERLVDK